MAVQSARSGLGCDIIMEPASRRVRKPGMRVRWVQASFAATQAEWRFFDWAGVDYRTVEGWAGASTAAARGVPNIQGPKPATTLKNMSAIDAAAEGRSCRGARPHFSFP